MKDELQKKLRDAAPNVYGNPVPKFAFGKYGFECGDGWFDLLLKLGQELEKIGPNPVFQIKAKFGELRVYVKENPEAVYEAIQIAVSTSRHTCQECGAPGQERESKFGYVYVACDPHNTLEG